MEQNLSYNDLLKAYNSQVEKYNTLIDTSPDGIMLLTAVRDIQGQIIDFVITHCNRAGTILGHFPPTAESQLLLTILPHLEGSEQFAMHKRVVEDGEPVLFETSFRNDNGAAYGWFIVSLMKLEDAVFSRFIDISEKKENELKLARQAAFYHGILEASINGVFACETVINKQGVVIDFIITKVNKAFTEMTAKSAAEVEGKSFINIFPNAIGSGTFDIYCTVVNTGKPIRKEVQDKIVSGNWYDISVGKINENTIAITFTDITARKKAFEDVEENRNLLNNILQYCPSGIAVSEVIRSESGEVTDAKVIMINDITEQFTGVSKAVALSKTINEIAPNALETGLFQMATSTLATGVPFRTQYFFPPNNVWLELGVSKMDENRLVNMYSDITATKQTQFRLENLVEELKKSNASLEEFTYAASHDLKEPIRKIRIFAERLKESHSANMDSEGKRILERLLTSSLRMRLLVDDLLSYSLITIHETEVEKVDLQEKVQQVLEDLEVEAEEKNALVHIGQLPVITGYRRQLQQLFQNLVGNALKYSKPGIAPIIHITSTVVPGHQIAQPVIPEDGSKNFYQIQIADNGIGFEQKNADKIFRIFQRLHDQSDYSGTGIGLSIVKKVIEKHHGYITVSSQPGIGSVFNVYLPQ